MPATITPQHLLHNRNALFEGGLQPHLYCLPILKRSHHQLALRAAATSGLPNYFLGTDTAPHVRRLKEASCGCAGVFSAPVAVEAYLSVFDQENALDRFEAFASINGPAFYGFPPDEERVTYLRRRTDIASSVAVENEEIVPLFGGGSVDWTLSAISWLKSATVNRHRACCSRSVLMPGTTGATNRVCCWPGSPTRVPCTKASNWAPPRTSWPVRASATRPWSRLCVPPAAFCRVRKDTF